jgi:hypothetical protein
MMPERAFAPFWKSVNPLGRENNKLLTSYDFKMLRCSSWCMVRPGNDLFLGMHENTEELKLEMW